MLTARPFLARLLAPWIAAALLWLGTRLAVEVDPELIERTTMVVVDVLLLFGSALLSLYGVIHRGINKKWNPADVASPEKAHTALTTGGRVLR